jgi:ABC-type polysaccharide/polyol phosphate export permease
MVDAYRAALLRGEWPTPASLLSLAGVAVAAFLVGLGWFRRASYRFADEL